MKYVLDPTAFALDENISEHDFKVYVNRLILWDKWLVNYPEDIYVLSSTCDLLCNMQYFPIYPVFAELTKKYKIDFVQASDLNKMINRLLTNAKKIDRIGNDKPDDDVIFIGLKIKEEMDWSSRPGDLKNSFEQLLWYLYCQCRKKNKGIESFVVIGKNLSNNISLSVDYQTIIEEDGKLKEVVKNDNVKIYCQSSLVNFFKDNDSPLAILQQTDSKDDLSLAVRVAVYQNGRLKMVADTLDKFNFVIQDSFMKEFNTNHYQSNSTVLNSLMEAMSHTLLGINNEKKREDYRTGIGGNNPQKIHGDYAAWRRFVTTSIKYQYWQKDDKFKFANIGEHDYYVCQWED